MKIAYFTDSFYPHIDGVTTYVGVVVRALLSQGHEVMVVAPRWDGVTVSEVEKFVPGAKVVLVPGIRPFFYPDMKLGAPTPKSVGVVSKFAPDLIHFHTPGLMGFEATMLSRLLRVPLVTTFHTYYMEPEGFVSLGLKQDGPASKVLQESLWRISERVHAPCDAVIAPTKYVGRDLRRRWKSAAIAVIPGAVELNAFANHSQRTALRKKYNVHDKTVFLSVGRLGPEKHFELLITSFSMMLMRCPNARLVFLGDGLARPELEYITKVLGVSHAVQFVGSIPYHELTRKNYYSMGDVFVTPSTWDTQGLSIVEAMASGLPVVAYNYRAMPEVVGKAGILAKHLDQYGFGQAMSDLAEDSKLREEYSQMALEQSRQYEITLHTDRLLRLYRKLIASS